MFAKKIGGILLLLCVTTVVFAKCIDQVQNFKTRRYCEDYQSCDTSEYLQNCCANWQEDKTDWTDCLEDCEPGTCTNWTEHARAGSYDCHRHICVKIDPKTTLCEDYECSDESKVDELYSTCTDPVCDKRDAFGNISRIVRRDPSEFTSAVLKRTK